MHLRFCGHPRGLAERLALQSRSKLGFLPPARTCRRVHTEAADGFGGSHASFYEKSRPGYPVQVLRAIEDELRRSRCTRRVGRGLSDGGDNIVDLGCGTGKFAREILPFARAEGMSLVGVEPVKAMRDQFETTLPGIRVVEGTGEAIPVHESSAGAVIAAQSFHWMSSAATLREVHRVLVPGGLFVLLWNTRDYTVPWVRALEDIIDPFYGSDVPRQHGGPWRQSFRDLEQQSSDGGQEAGSDGKKRRMFFGKLTEHHFKHSQLLTPDELDDLMCSISVIATRPEPERAEASRRARELVETHPDTQRELRKSRRVELFYDTEVYWCRKLDPCSR